MGFFRSEPVFVNCHPNQSTFWKQCTVTPVMCLADDSGSNVLTGKTNAIVNQFIVSL